jgi:hypothetical protein
MMRVVAHMDGDAGWSGVVILSLDYLMKWLTDTRFDNKMSPYISKAFR